MSEQTFLDPELASRICLTLLHSLWQIVALVVLVWCCDRLLCRHSVQRSYGLHVFALFAVLLAMPITFQLMGTTSQVQLPTAVEAALPKDQAIVVDQLETAPTAEVESSAIERGPSIVVQPSVVVANEPVLKTPSWSHVASWILVVYALGVVAMLVRLVRSMVRTNRLSSGAKPIRQGPLFEAFRALAGQWSVRVVPVLAETQELVVPKVVGLLRPVILLPASAIAGLSPGELEMILAHELAHIRRHDMWINLVQRIAESILFFNPALWYLSRRISSLREYCCDELTCEAMAGDAADSQVRYAATLLRIVELAKPQITQGEEYAALAASGRSPSELRRRVARLFGEPIREPMRITRSGVLMIATLALLLLGVPTIWKSAAQSDDAGSESNSTATAKEYAGKFSFGGKLEIIAIGTHDEEPQRWWDADGKLLEEVPFTWETQAQVTAAEQVWRRIVFRLHDFPEDAALKWSVIGSGGSGSGNIKFNDHRETKEYHTRYFGISKQQQNINLRVGLATGAWKTEAEIGAGGSGSVGSKDKQGLTRGVVFSPVLETTYGPTVVVSHNYSEQNVRVVLIDKQGEVHEQETQGSSGAGGFYQLKASFPEVAMSDIDRFEFQTREYEWVEVKGLPVSPADLDAGTDSEVKTQIELPTHLIENLADFKNAGLKAITEGETTSNLEWLKLPNDIGAVTRFEIDSNELLIQWIDNYLERPSGIISSWERMLVKGFNHSPYGPQVNFKMLIKSILGNRISIVVNEPESNPQGIGDFLLAWSADEPNQVIAFVEKFMKNDPNAQRAMLGNLPIWKVTEKENVTGVVGVAHGHLLVASEMNLLKKVLASQQEHENEDVNLETEKLRLLAKQVNFYLEIWKRIKALHKVGARGGETEKEAQARSHYYLARAELEKAKTLYKVSVKRHQQAVEAAKKTVTSYKNAAKAAEDTVEAIQAVYDSGRVTLDVLLQAGQERLDAQLALSESLADLQRLQDGLKKIEKSPRTSRDQGENELWKKIAQRNDYQLRGQALNELTRMLQGSASERVEALRALSMVGDIPFDRKSMLHLVVHGISHEDADVRHMTLIALPTMGAVLERYPLLMSLVDDSSVDVRMNLASCMIALARKSPFSDSKKISPILSPILPKLLNDSEPKVVEQTIKSLWGYPLTPEINSRLIELSREPELVGTVVYFALSTRPLISQPVAERLIEVLDDSTMRLDTRGRAAWGLGHQQLEESAKPAVAKALIRCLDETLDKYLTQQSMYGLKRIGNSAGQEKLRELAEQDERAWVRLEAQKMLR